MYNIDIKNWVIQYTYVFIVHSLIPKSMKLIDFRNLTEGLLVTNPIELQNKE